MATHLGYIQQFTDLSSALLQRVFSTPKKTYYWGCGTNNLVSWELSGKGAAHSTLLATLPQEAEKTIPSIPIASSQPT